MKKLTETKRLLHATYIILLAGMLLLVLLICFGKTMPETSIGNSDYTDLGDLWTLDEEGEKPVDFNKLGSYLPDGSDTLTIYYTLPDMAHDLDIVYRSKDVYTKLFAGDTLLYETSVSEHAFYNASPGNLWNITNIDHSYSGQTLSLQIQMVYDANAFTVDHVYLGSSVDYIIDFVHNKLNALLLSIIMIIMGAYFVIYDLLPGYRGNHKTHGLFYLGVYAMLVGMWSLIEANVLQFFVYDQRILQLVDNIIMIVDTLPLFLYLDCEQNVFKNPVTKWLAGIDLVYIAVCLVAQFSGITDLHVLLPGAQIALLAGSAILVIWTIRELITTRRNKTNSAPALFQMCGIVFLFLTGVAEYAKYTQADGMDRAQSLRLGMVFFIIFFGISSQLKTYRLLEQGMKYDIVSSLAYKDGLTGLGNRTAYLEQLDSCIKTHLPQLGIVFLDINNLKQVNDTLGHEMGDELIKEAARIIDGSFGQIGKAYRIGGDEFCILIDSEPLTTVYQDALIKFQKLSEEANNTNIHHLQIHIAQGFSICKGLSEEKIDEAIKLADEAMYLDKKRLKGMPV